MYGLGRVATDAGALGPAVAVGWAAGAVVCGWALAIRLLAFILACLRRLALPSLNMNSLALIIILSQTF